MRAPTAVVRDGREGFIEFFTPFLERNPVRDIQILRTIEDGNFVFVHVYQNLNNGEAQWVMADIFHTDEDGKIIEHWDVIAKYKWPTVSGRSMVDGQPKSKISISPRPTRPWCKGSSTVS